MPLYTFNYNAAGGIAKDPETGILEHDVLETQGEISDTDICPPDDLEHSWLKAVFTMHRPYEEENEDTNEYKRSLSEFLSTHMKGPYYIHDDALDNESVLSLVILDPKDVDTFKSHYKDWQFSKDSVKANAETLTEWRNAGKVVEDKTLYKYASMRLN